MILYLASDLLWATRVKATAADLGIAARPVRDLGMLEARLGDSPVRGLIVDLEAEGAWAGMIERLRGERAGARERSIGIVAFGPHVAVDRLEAARRAGADRVLARGAFDRDLASILSGLMGS